MRGYSLISKHDGLAYDFVVANNAKQAKRLMMENQSEWIYEESESFINYHAKWVKNINLEGLNLGDFVIGIDLINRNICSYLEYCKCPICKAEDVSVSRINKELICCETCEND